MLQGDPASPVLFNLATEDSTKIIQDMEANIIMYADDIAIGVSNKDQLQKAKDNLYTWAEENRFKINKEKTLQMVFRRGGRLALTKKSP